MKALTFFTQVFQGHIIFPAKENSIISIVKKLRKGRMAQWLTLGFPIRGKSVWSLKNI